MGICASCLGTRRRDSYDEDDESRLLFDDASGMQYGSFGEQQMNGQDDPLETQREIEALQRVVARTSDNMVDIFEIAPIENPQRTAPTAYALAGQEARLMRYHSLLSKLGSEDDTAVNGTKLDWIADEDDTMELQRSMPPIKAESEDALVGNFAEAAAAMS